MAMSPTLRLVRAETDDDWDQARRLIQELIDWDVGECRTLGFESEDVIRASNSDHHRYETASVATTLSLHHTGPETAVVMMVTSSLPNELTCARHSPATAAVRVAILQADSNVPAQ